MTLRPVLCAWEPGCTCPLIEFDGGGLDAIITRECPVHGKLFPKPPLTEREKYERAFRESK